MRFGVHVGIGGGFVKSIAESLAARCQCIQIFAGNPRGWRITPYDAVAWRQFRSLRRQHDIRPTVIHTSYLINLTTDDASLHAKSIGRVEHDLQVAAKGGIEYVNTHLGSFGHQERKSGLERVCQTIAGIMERAPRGPMLLLENSAGAGALCAGSIEELGFILKEIGSRRVAACIDTAHAWASGYDISDARGVTTFLRSVEKHIGFARVRALHLNDTKVALGARRDLHWHIGQGCIGETGFRCLLRTRHLAHAAGICETPKTPELDFQNVAAVRRLAGSRAEHLA